MFKKLFSLVCMCFAMLGIDNVSCAGAKKVSPMEVDSGYFDGFNNPLTDLAPHYAEVQCAIGALDAGDVKGVYKQLFTQLMLATYVISHCRDFQPSEFLWEQYGEAVGSDPIVIFIGRIGNLAARMQAEAFEAASGQTRGWMLEIVLEINSVLGHIGYLSVVGDDEHTDDIDTVIKRSEQQELVRLSEQYVAGSLDSIIDVGAKLELVLCINLRLLNKLVTLFSKRPTYILKNKSVIKISRDENDFAAVAATFVYPAVVKIKEALRQPGNALELAVEVLHKEFKMYCQYCEGDGASLGSFAFDEHLEATLGRRLLSKSSSSVTSLGDVSSSVGSATSFSKVAPVVGLNQIFKQLVQTLHCTLVVYEAYSLRFCKNQMDRACGEVLARLRQAACLLVIKIIELRQFILSPDGIDSWKFCVLRDIQKMLSITSLDEQYAVWMGDQDKSCVSWRSCGACDSFVFDSNAKEIGRLITANKNKAARAASLSQVCFEMRCLPPDQQEIRNWLNYSVMPAVSAEPDQCDVLLDATFEKLVEHVTNPKVIDSVIKEADQLQDKTLFVSIDDSNTIAMVFVPKEAQASTIPIIDIMRFDQEQKFVLKLALINHLNMLQSPSQKIKTAAQ